jgi:hypothetical protein
MRDLRHAVPLKRLQIKKNVIAREPGIGRRAVVLGSTGIPACAAGCYLRGVEKQENQRKRSLILHV